jgi:uncharacterized protein (DUF302 family)
MIALPASILRTLLIAAATFAWLAPAHAGSPMVVKESTKSVSETIDALQKVLEAKGIGVFGRVDHQANAKKAGLELPPTTLLIFGNPKLGTPLMQTNRQIGIDLPMKALAWQDADGKVYIGYTDPEKLKARYGIAGRDAIFAKMAKALGAMTDKAAGK